MSVTILEVLQNADHNINATHPVQIEMGKEQLKNAIVLLEKGYDIDAIFDYIVESYGSVEDAPEAVVTERAS